MNGAGVPPTDWKFHEEVQEGREGRGGEGREGLAGGVCLKLHWVHLKNQKHVVFLLLSSMGFIFFAKMGGGVTTKQLFCGFTPVKGECLYAALSAPPLSSDDTIAGG